MELEYTNSTKNIKWFILGAALVSNIRYWTGYGATNKKLVANLSVDGSTIKLTTTKNGG